MLEMNLADVKDAEISYDDCDQVVIDVPKSFDKIIFFNKPVRVNDAGLIFAEGTYYVINEDRGNYEANWSLTAIYPDVPDDKFDFSEFMYIEQDSPHIALHNLLAVQIIGEK